MKRLLAGCLLVLPLALATTDAAADATLDYHSSGKGCRGDFDRVLLKDTWLRVDSNQGGHSGSFIYDGTEKLAIFLDHREHHFMQIEMDEDAVDFNADMMASLRKMMRNQAGFDPFDLAKSVCPGAFDAGQRDGAPDQPLNCTPDPIAAGMHGKAADRRQRATTLDNSRMPAMSADNQRMMEQMLQKQMATLAPEQRAQMQRGLGQADMSGVLGAPKNAAAPAPAPETVRDSGETTVEGFACSRRLHVRGEQVVRDECFATTAALKLSDRETARLASVGKVMKSWSHSMLPMDAEGAPPQATSADRVLVQRVCFAEGRETGRASLHIERESIPASLFAPPSGYSPFDLTPGQQAPHD
jgi:hypothetical protein